MTRILFEYDLLVFILFWFPCPELVEGLLSLRLRYQVSLYDSGETLGAPYHRLGDLIGIRDADEKFLKAVLQEFLLHTLVAAFEEELGADSVTLGEPLGRLTGLELHIVVAGADLDLDLLGLRDLYLSLGDLFLLTTLVFKFTIIYDLRNGRDG